MALDRAGAEALGWVFAADQPGYVRAEKFLPNGDLIHMADDEEYKVVAAVDAWESYPVQAPNTRTNDLGPDTVEVTLTPVAPESGVDAPPADPAPVEAPVPAPPTDGTVPA